MPTNPYADPEALKREAQIQQLSARTGAAPEGFDAKNWADPNMHSVKYDAGGFLSGRSRPSEIAPIVSGADFQKRFPGATFDGKDRINFQGALSDGASGVPVYDIDVLKGADRDSDSSAGFWWGHDVPGMNQGPTGGQAQMPAPVVLGGNPATESSTLAKIMAELQAAQQGDQSPAAREAIMQLLQQEAI